MNAIQLTAGKTASECERGVRPVLLLGILLGLTLITYGFTANDFFLSDDFGLLRGAAGAQSFLDAAGLSESRRGTWLRPLVDLSWWANYRICGLEPLGFHLVNLLQHAVNAWLVGLLVFTLYREKSAAYLAAGLFAIFPIHAEAVVWLSGRYDVFCAGAGLASLLFWIQFVSQRGGWPVFAISVFFFVAALASKEMALAIPFMIAALSLCYYRPIRLRVYAGLTILLALVLVYFSFRYFLLEGVGGYQDDGESLHKQFSVSRALRFIGRALYFCLIPTHRKLNPEPWHPLRVLPFTAMIVCGVLWWKQGSLGHLWRSLWPLMTMFVLSLTPLMGWAWLGRDNQSARFLYLPSAFICGALGILFTVPVVRRVHKGLRNTAIVMVALAFLAGAIQTAGTWHGAANRAEQTIQSIRSYHRQSGGISELIAAGPPDNHDGAYIFRNGFTAAVRLFVDPKVRVRILSGDEWNVEPDTVRDASVLLLTWDQDGHALLRSVALDGDAAAEGR